MEDEIDQAAEVVSVELLDLADIFRDLGCRELANGDAKIVGEQVRFLARRVEAVASRLRSLD